MHYYRHSGLLFASEIALPDWDFCAVEAAAADVIISVGKDGADQPSQSDGWVIDSDTLRFTIDGTGSWKVSGGRRIEIFPAADADPRDLTLFTLGTARAAIGYQRGHPMWHGSAVAPQSGGEALLFCGTQEQGKSTLAAALVARGFTLLADDLSRVVVPCSGNRAAIYPSAARMKLWADAVETLALKGSVMAQDARRADKYHCEIGQPDRADAPMPLAGIVVLDWGEDCGFERLSGAEAAVAAIAATNYRPQLLEALGLHEAQARMVLAVIAEVPVYRLTRPRNLSALQDSVNLISPLLLLGQK